MRTYLACCVVVLAACKGKPKHQEPPKNVEKPATGSAGDHDMKPAPNLALPPISDAPIPKSTKPVDRTTLERLSKKTFEGFGLTVRGVTDKAVEVRLITADFPKIAATVTIATCDNPNGHPFTCVPIDLAKWKEKEAALKEKTLQPELRTAPDTVWELGNTELDSAQMIFTYQLGQSFGSNGGGYTDAYALYYNDGINQARVVAEFKDDPVADAATMAKQVPKQDLETVAKAFMDAYIHSAIQ